MAENEYCGTLSDPNGPFAGCILALTPDFVHQVYYVSCEFDICALYNDTVVMKELACSLLQNFYKACREFDSQVSTEWREDADCRELLTAQQIKDNELLQLSDYTADLVECHANLIEKPS